MSQPIRFMLSRVALGIAAIGIASAQAQSVRDLSPEQTQAFTAAQPKPGSLSILTLLDRANATYGLGEVVRLAVKANEDAYVTVFNIGASGKVTQLFPNASQTDNRVKANETIEVPSRASGVQIKVSGPLGAELIKVIATSKPLKIIPDMNFQTGTGIFRSVEGGVEALNRDLAVVAGSPAADVKVAVINQVIRTVAAQSAPAPAPAGALVVPTTVAEQAVPLLLAVDKRSYRVGESLTIGVTPLQPCHLTVASKDQTGKIRLLFPTVALPSSSVAAMQTVLVSGAAAPQQVVGTTPGVETITAVCSSQPRPSAAALKSAEDYLGEPERAALDRDLAVVQAQPATVSFAETTVAITP